MFRMIALTCGMFRDKFNIRYSVGDFEGELTMLRGPYPNPSLFMMYALVGLFVFGVLFKYDAI